MVVENIIQILVNNLKNSVLFCVCVCEISKQIPAVKRGVSIHVQVAYKPRMEEQNLKFLICLFQAVAMRGKQ